MPPHSQARDFLFSYIYEKKIYIYLCPVKYIAQSVPGCAAGD